MAFLECPNACAICEEPVSGYVGGVPKYYCGSCWETHQSDIVLVVAWAAALLGIEKARRKRRNRLMKSVGLPRFTNKLRGEYL